MPNKIIVNAISAVLAMGLAQTTTAAPSIPASTMGVMAGMEKCYGIAKAGRNDCSTAQHHCSGEAKQNGQPNEWIAVPAGVCDRIIGGSLSSKGA